jgi:hypothetical protein
MSRFDPAAHRMVPEQRRFEDFVPASGSCRKSRP